MRRNSLLVLAFGLATFRSCLFMAACHAQDDQAIDWSRARALHQRVLRGEKLTPEDQAYHDRAAHLLNSRRGPGSGGLSPRESTGLIPLTDLKDGKYKGERGGLYGDGKNEPPPGHLSLAMKEAASVRPLDTNGKPS